jgi:hypothetical protein
MKKKNAVTKSFKVLFCALFLGLFVLLLPKQVMASTPVEIESAWVKMGDYQVRNANFHLYIRKNGKTVKTISSVYKAEVLLTR